MDKREVMERLAQVQSVVERLPDDTDWIHPNLEATHSVLEAGLEHYERIPEIQFCGEDFPCVASLFHAEPTRVPRDDETYDAQEEFYVDGVRLYRLIKTKEENEHGEQGSGNRESSGGLPDGESPEENRVERGHSGSGHQSDGEYPS